MGAPSPAASGEPTIGCFSCAIHQHRWGLRLDAIARVLPMAAAPVPVPNSPPWLLGIISLEAIIAPVVDPGVVLGYATRHAPTSLDDMVVLVGVGEEYVALLVRDAGPLTAVAPTALTAPPGVPYAAARYAPSAPPDPALEGVVGFLAIERMAADCLAELEQGEVIG